MAVTETKTATACPEVSADLGAMLKHLLAGTPIDAELARRVRERSERMTDELRQRWGDRDVAVDLIREIRNEP
jgi:hypothetical protein